jgi:hypothetical protein
VPSGKPLFSAPRWWGGLRCDPVQGQHLDPRGLGRRIPIWVIFSSRWPGLNRRPAVYETAALPLSYIGGRVGLLPERRSIGKTARRMAGAAYRIGFTSCGSTPSRRRLVTAFGLSSANAACTRHLPPAPARSTTMSAAAVFASSGHDRARRGRARAERARSRSRRQRRSGPEVGRGTGENWAVVAAVASMPMTRIDAGRRGTQRHARTRVSVAQARRP